MSAALDASLAGQTISIKKGFRHACLASEDAVDTDRQDLHPATGKVCGLRCHTGGRFSGHIAFRGAGIAFAVGECTLRHRIGAAFTR